MGILRKKNSKAIPKVKVNHDSQVTKQVGKTNQSNNQVVKIVIQQPQPVVKKRTKRKGGSGGGSSGQKKIEVENLRQAFTGRC